MSRHKRERNPEWLRNYPLYAQLQTNIEQANESVSARQKRLFAQLGITSGVLGYQP